MNLDQTTAIRIAIRDTTGAIARQETPEPTRTALQAHLDALLKEELRALTGQALAGNSVGFAAQNEKFAQDMGLRKDPQPAPWYPDDPGDWVEGHPRDLPPDTLMAGWLFMAEREAKNYTIPEGGWAAKELTNPNIVAYKVVKS